MSTPASPTQTFAEAAQAIRNLLSRYCELQDTGDMEATSELFRYSSYIVPGISSAFGYDEVLKAKSGNRKYDDGTLRTKHVTTNSIINVDLAAERATAAVVFPRAASHSRAAATADHRRSVPRYV